MPAEAIRPSGVDRTLPLGHLAAKWSACAADRIRRGLPRTTLIPSGPGDGLGGSFPPAIGSALSWPAPQLGGAWIGLSQ